MASVIKPLGNITSALESSTSREKVDFYNSWADNYDKDMTIVEYRGPSLAAKFISSHFSGDRDAAVVLDVACGTGLVAKELKPHGFKHFVGVDGSQRMVELSRETGLYQELKKCMLGEEPLSVQWGSFDVVAIVGALSCNHAPVKVIRELCSAAKPGGYIFMTTRVSDENGKFKAALEQELKTLEEEGLWTPVEVTEVKDWHKVMSEQEQGYIPGALYLYKKI